MTVIYFYHIPKTGGTYVNTYLKQLAVSLNAEYISFYDSKTVLSPSNITHYVNKLKNINPNKITIIHHHHGYPGMHYSITYIEKLRQMLKKVDKRLYLFTVIRDPIERAWSGINYNKCIEEISKKNYILKKSNYIIRYILYNKHFDRYQLNKGKLQSFYKIIKIFDNIFNIKHIHMIQRIISHLLNKPSIIQMPTYKINTTTYTLPLTKIDKKFIERYNRLDIEFYNRYNS